MSQESTSEEAQDGGENLSDSVIQALWKAEGARETLRNVLRHLKCNIKHKIPAAQYWGNLKFVMFGRQL